MTAPAFYRAAARLILERAGEYFDEDERRELTLVLQADDHVLENWNLDVQLAGRVTIRASRGLDRAQSWLPVRANYSAVGPEDARKCAQFAHLAACVADLVARLQALLDAEQPR